MTATRIIEEDHGTYTRSPHPHNGYYAGDFIASVTRPGKPTAATSGMNDTRHSPQQVFDWFPVVSRLIGRPPT